MKFTAVALAALVSSVAAQGVTSAIAPQASPPANCEENYDGTFQISAAKITKKRDLLVERQASGILTLTLNDGILLDAANRTGYIADNFQFQFDGPPQAGAIYTAGFSVCSNGSLALGGSAVWYQCLSGSFYNLYDRHWAAQCEPILLNVYNPKSSATTSALPLTETAPVTAVASGAASSAVPTTIVTTTANSSLTTTESSNPSASASGEPSSSASGTGEAAGTGAGASGSGAPASGASPSATGASTGAAVAATPVAGIGALAVGIVGAVVLL